MRCKNVLTRVDALRTGELESADERGVREHLTRCRSCSASLHDVNDLATAIKSLALTPPKSFRDVAPADGLELIDDVWVAFSRRGLRMIHRGGSEEEFRARYARRYGRALERATLADPLRKQVIAALEGEGVDKPRLDVEEPGELEARVMEAMAKIPRGEVRSYSWLAAQIGKPKAVRAVANCVARNILPFVVPCHRVVPASGGTGKYAFGSAAKRELLQREGVDVEQLDALARGGVRFIGSRTTHIFCCPTCRDARRIREENRVPFRDADEAVEKGFRPCKRCQPAAA
jgi:O-6-methylguanine DNA methyltransferase